MSTRFDAEPFGTQGLYHIVRHDARGKHYLRSSFRGILLECTRSGASILVKTLEHDHSGYRESRWIAEETVYQGGNQYPNMFTANTAK